MARLKCFVMMPFQREFDPVLSTIQQAASGVLPGEEIDCCWLKDVHAAGRITDDIIDALRESVLCVADATGSNPNVMWETGYAMALGKPTILLGQRVEDLPFDLRVHRVLPYRLNELGSLGEHLKVAIRQTLARYELKGKPALPYTEPMSRTIAVTGSARADPARASRRVETLLRPYLNPGRIWYCGSTGTSDEAALRYLSAHRQRAVAVGYTRFDFSPEVKESVEAGRIQFLDSSVEPVSMLVGFV
ncbi:MAG: hypothetical protein AAB225_19740 [Acidobacteriota bacterium]